MSAHQPGTCGCPCGSGGGPPPCTNSCADFLDGITEVTVDVAGFAGGFFANCQCDGLNGSFVLARIGSSCAFTYSGSLPPGGQPCSSYTWSCGVTLTAGRWVISVGLAVSGPFANTADLLWTYTVPADCTFPVGEITLNLATPGPPYYPALNGLDCTTTPLTLTLAA